MKCDYCDKERDQGQNYKFHYGQGEAKVTERSRYDPQMKEYNVKAVIVGSDQAWICKWCVSRRILLTLVLGSFLILGLLNWGMVRMGYASMSYRSLNVLMNQFGPNLGMQMSRIIRTFLNFLSSEIVRTVWATGGLVGVFLLWDGLKEIGVVGENLAIKASQTRLNEYNLFANSKQFRKYFK